MLRTLASIAAATTLLLGVALAQPTPARITAVAADPASVDEGARVDFTATLEPGGEGSLVHTWDFGDGVTATGIDALAFGHRYADDGTYTVIHSIERADGSDRRSAATTVTVANVAPELRRIATSHGPIPGLPVTLTATAVDSGDDALAYTWDFGDGTPPTEPSEERDAVHTFAEAGTYVVSVTVDDGDGGSDTLGLEVVVGDGFVFEASGGVVGAPRESRAPVLAGYPVERRPDGLLRLRLDADESSRSPSCLVILSSQSLSPLGYLTNGTALTFTFALERGLAVGDYPIAVQRNENAIVVRDPYELELRNPGTVYANLIEVDGDGFDSDVTSFHGTGGTFTIHRYDGLRLEASFQLDVEESLNTLQLGAGATPRSGHVFGAVRHDVPRTVGDGRGGANATAGATFGDGYLCGSDEELAVVSHDLGQGPERTGTAGAPDSGASSALPAPSNVGPVSRIGMPWRWEAYADGEAKLEFTFDRPMNPDTLNDRTIWLDIPAAVGPGTASFEPITGIVEAVDDRTFRFLPDWDMRDGVTYHVTIRGGAEGVRGASGEVLEADYTWGFQTQVELESVVVTATQVSRGAMLVPDKPTAVRVYAFWSGHDDVPIELQALEIAARVAIEVDGVAVYAPRNVMLTRPDQLGEASRRSALHTVNFFGWRPTQVGGSSTLAATVALLSEFPEARFESRPVTVRHWDRSPILTIEYFYLEVGSWAGGVPAATLNDHPRLFRHSTDFATQNLPVVGIDTWWRGPLAIDEPEMELAATNDVWRTICIVPNTEFVFTDELLVPDRYAAGHRYDWRVAWELHRAAADGGADVVVGIVPDNVARDCGWSGALIRVKGGSPSDPTTPRVVLIRENAPVPVLAHELGHFFGLCHEDDDHDGCLYAFGTSIEGFRIALDGASGFNKSETEGNGEESSNDLVPLMFSRLSSNDPDHERRRFITDQHYRHLFTTLPQRGISYAPAQLPSLTGTWADDVWAQAADGTATHVSVWALVAPDGRSVVIDRLRPTSRAAIDDALGRYTVTLVDEAGTELARATVAAHAGDVVRQPPAPGKADDGAPGGTSAEPMRVLDAVLPYDERAHAVVVAFEGQELARVTRSHDPPTLEARLEGTTVHWDATDADGDAVVVDVDYAPDGRAWVPLAVGRAGTGSRTLPSGLEPGSEPVLRLRASDGFDTVERWVPLEASPPLQAIVRSHADGATIEPEESLWIGFNAPIATDQDPDTLATLEGPGGQPIEVDARLLPGDRRLLLTPRAPLEPGQYRVDVGAVYRAFGTAPPGGSAWRVVVEVAAEAEPDAVEAAASEPSAVAAPASIPPVCAGVDRAAVEALLPDGFDLEAVDDAAGCTVRVRVAGAPDRTRADLEFALLRQRYLPTRNVQEGAAVVIDFEGNGLAGSVRLEPDGAGTALVLRMAPR